MPKKSKKKTKAKRKAKRVAAKKARRAKPRPAAKQRGKSANASIPRAKAADARARAPEKKRVTAQQVADFVSRDGGASMAELEAEFGIKAHPMRSKIFAARHSLGYAIEHRDDRYFGTPPVPKPDDADPPAAPSFGQQPQPEAK